jgi:hypothetical protein
MTTGVRVLVTKSNGPFAYATPEGDHGECGLRLFRCPRGDRPDVVVVTEPLRARGPGIIAAFPILVAQVAACYRIDLGCLRWFEHFPADGHIDVVEFDVLPGPPPRPGPARRCARSVAQLERLLGRALEPLRDPAPRR